MSLIVGDMGREHSVRRSVTDDSRSDASPAFLNYSAVPGVKRQLLTGLCRFTTRSSCRPTSRENVLNLSSETESMNRGIGPIVLPDSMESLSNITGSFKFYRLV